MTPEQFKQARKRLGLTQPQLANDLGVTRQTIYNYEKGVHPVPKLVHLHMMLAAGGETAYYYYQSQSIKLAALKPKQVKK